LMIKRQSKSQMFDQLPGAKLHLDEVRDIVTILSTANSDATNESVIGKYRVRGYESDTLEEVESLGGSARRFQITVENGRRWSTLRLEPVLTVLLLSCPESDYWTKYGRVRKIFEDNAICWKNVIAETVKRVPSWLLLAVCGVSIFSYVWKPVIRHGVTAGVWLTGIAIFILSMSYTLVFGGSVVRLHYSHTRGLRRWVEEHGTQIALVVVSAILGPSPKK